MGGDAGKQSLDECNGGMLDVVIRSKLNLRVSLGTDGDCHVTEAYKEEIRRDVCSALELLDEQVSVHLLETSHETKRLLIHLISRQAALTLESQIDGFDRDRLNALMRKHHNLDNSDEHADFWPAHAAKDQKRMEHNHHYTRRGNSLKESELSVQDLVKEFKRQAGDLASPLMLGKYTRDILDVQDAILAGDSNRGYEFTLIDAHGKQMVCSVETEEGREEWISKIQTAVEERALLPDSDEGFQFTLTDGRGKQVVCAVSTEALREEWVSLIRAAVAETDAPEKQDALSQPHHRPKWAAAGTFSRSMASIGVFMSRGVSKEDSDAVAAEKDSDKRSDDDRTAGSLGEETGSVQHEGPVRKRGQINRAFADRYFVLSESAIRYWKTKEDFENQKPEQGMLQCRDLKITETEYQEKQDIPTKLYPRPKWAQAGTFARSIISGRHFGEVTDTNAASSGEDTGNVHHEGPVRKRGQINRAFADRYFVLSEGAVRYWKTKEDFENQNQEQGMLLCRNLQIEKGLSWTWKGTSLCNQCGKDRGSCECFCHVCGHKKGGCSAVCNRYCNHCAAPKPICNSGDVKVAFDLHRETMTMDDDSFRQALRRDISQALGIHPLQVSASKLRFVEVQDGSVPPPTTHEGVVRKRGKLNTAFEERYFILSDGKLKNYQKKPVLLDEPHLQSGSHSMILRSLMYCSGMTVQALPDQGEGFEFMITLREGHHDGRHVVCSVNSDHERDTWMKKLRAATEEVDTEPETMPGSLHCHIHFISCRDAAWIMASPDFCVLSDKLRMSNGPQAHSSQDHVAGHDDIEIETEQQFVELHVTLGMEPKDVIDWQDEFKAAVAQDVAIAVRGDVGKIRVLGLQVDSVVVELGLAPGVCGNDMTALNAARDLQRQALDASSILRQGRMTSNCTSLKVTAVPQGYGHSCSCLSRSELMDAFLEQCNNVNGPLRQGAIFSLMTAAASWWHDYKHLACRFCGLTPDLCTCDCPGCHEKLDSCPVDCMLHAQLADPMPQVCLTCPPQSGPRQMLGSSSDKDVTLATLRAVPDAASGSQHARDIMPRENSEDTEEVYLPQMSTTMRSQLVLDEYTEITVSTPPAAISTPGYDSGDVPRADSPNPPAPHPGVSRLPPGISVAVDMPPSVFAEDEEDCPNSPSRPQPGLVSVASVATDSRERRALLKPPPGLNNGSSGAAKLVGVPRHPSVQLCSSINVGARFVGLQVTAGPPHAVVQVDDLVDVNFVRHDEAGYCNPHIDVGDVLFEVDGTPAQHVSIQTIHQLFVGELHAPVTLSLVRAQTGQVYQVTVLRHNFHSFDSEQHKRARWMERAAVHAPWRNTGHYAGLEVTTQPPHRVVAVDDLVDVNFVPQGQHGYTNPEVRPGDYILSVDGQAAENASLQQLHAVLRGTEHSPVEIRLRRCQNQHTTCAGAEYTIVVLRHQYHEFDMMDRL